MRQLPLLVDYMCGFQNSKFKISKCIRIHSETVLRRQGLSLRRIIGVMMMMMMMMMMMISAKRNVLSQVLDL